MKKYLPFAVLIFIYPFFNSCTEKSTISKLKSETSISALLNQERDKENILLLIKNDECGACKIFYDYIDTNFESIILPKLPKNTKTYQISINDFNSQNMWLFHIQETYAFPTVLYLNKDNNIQSIHRGADLYNFTNFLNKLKNPAEASDLIDLKKQSILLKGYIALKENHIIPKPLFKEISKLNKQKPGFISALEEGYFYKYEKIHPERITYIKHLLQKSLKSSNQFYNTQQKLVDEL